MENWDLKYCIAKVDQFQSADMRKVVAMGPLAAEILMDCGNVMLAALTFSLVHFLKLKCFLI